MTIPTNASTSSLSQPHYLTSYATPLTSITHPTHLKPLLAPQYARRSSSLHTRPQNPIAMIKRNDAIILTLFLIAVFVIFFAWFLYSSCRRAVDAEVHEMITTGKDVEAR
jgi:hypothetical protein